MKQKQIFNNDSLKNRIHHEDSKVSKNTVQKK